jgi:transglutaminase-like putative cysteine protease
MIIEIQHETRLTYTSPVVEWQSEFRMEPVSDSHQSCQTFFLRVSQPTVPFRFLDGFGNRVHHVNFLAPQTEVRILAAGVVETHVLTPALDRSAARLPTDEDAFPLGVLDYTTLRGPVSPTPKLNPLLDSLMPQNDERVVDYALRVSDFIHHGFKYAKAVTSASSPIDDVLTLGKGVCQDFAHLLIAVLRKRGVPTRYVSGYIHRPDKESQSHAWCEVWVPDLGWVGLDPTNNVLVDNRFVKVAMGRDYTDVPPNKGIFRGSGTEHMSVRVETRELERLPTLSWQDQLPPLHVPLVEVLLNVRKAEENAAEEQQQQQQ